MKRYKRYIIIVLVIGSVISLFWLWNGFTAWLDNGENKPGRDTVAFWKLKDEGFVYEICRGFNGKSYHFDFSIYNSLYIGEGDSSYVEGIHFYANTKDYIFLITTDNVYYCVEKKTGVISSSLFDAVPPTEEQVCFINLFNDKEAHIGRFYD